MPESGVQAGSQPPDTDGADMGKLIALGSAFGIPLVFAILVAGELVIGIHGSGALLIAAWGALSGGTFIGCAVGLSKRVGELGSEH